MTDNPLNNIREIMYCEKCDRFFVTDNYYSVTHCLYCNAQYAPIRTSSFAFLYAFEKVHRDHNDPNFYIHQHYDDSAMTDSWSPIIRLPLNGFRKGMQFLWPSSFPAVDTSQDPIFQWEELTQDGLTVTLCIPESKEYTSTIKLTADELNITAILTKI
jgi:hypothetical protein